MTATAIRRTGLLLALTAALLVAALVLIGREGADDGEGLPAAGCAEDRTDQTAR